MTTRVLPRDEWPRLAGTELQYAVPYLPADTQVVVVEDGGLIVGCWAVLRYVHVEGLWVHPGHRGKGGVARRLFLGAQQVARDMGVSVVLTASLSEDIDGLLEHAGAVRLPGATYALPLREKETT